MSNLIKSSHVVSVEDLRKLEWFNRYVPPVPEEEWVVDETPKPDAETISLRDEIIADAQQFAEEHVRDAVEHSNTLLANAESQINEWWQERRIEDEAIVTQAREEGFQSGYDDGRSQALHELHQEWQQRIEEASSLLTAAYRMREQIIQESEPFLVDLSCAIAEKLIGRQLSVSPEIAIEMIRKSLARRREQGVITLCVAPQHLAFMQAAREELTLSIDSQAELHILPDPTVRDHGCVIRSSFGSIDARIDTQLTEIKRELVQLALDSDEWRNADEHSEA
ncbi:Flagellar assembly protein FliH/Type III secretion system HrpE [Paenibacillus curdlanolyticus YK9]|uniref:Flagellar assembly protein FliH/Type III secretion system HrpE n=1 Tax=Paenibacillus curdlanolyticus YK9 TaxID=717606 RepID=E0I442_9BACL|nr:FliH/SctL family protein [Paenibacillus curdlanolyticus]EFM13056.1 Flagellar assembly protein FliH/Type III secretion system HrpE [Paenibacillus curdlanolyticus YK9]